MFLFIVSCFFLVAISICIRRTFIFSLKFSSDLNSISTFWYIICEYKFDNTVFLFHNRQLMRKEGVRLVMVMLADLDPIFGPQFFLQWVNPDPHKINADPKTLVLAPSFEIRRLHA